MSLLHLLARLHDGITRAGAVAAAACLGAIVCLYVYEVVTRYFLNAPTTWGTALAVYLLLALVTLMMPFLTMQGDHVSVRISSEALGPRGARIAGLAIVGVAAAITGAAAWFALDETLATHARNTLTTDALFVPKWWLLALLSYGLAGSTLHFLRQLWRQGAEARR